MSRILIIDGHPDPNMDHFVHAAASAYQEGAETAFHNVRRIDVARLNFPILRSQREWNDAPPVSDIREAQDALQWAEHVAIFYPMWLGDIPALLKGFLEQVARPTFAFRYRHNGFPEKLLKGRSARVVVSMGMPAAFYSLVYRAHSLKSLKRNILGFVGFSPVRQAVIGAVEGSPHHRDRWLNKLQRLGEQAR
ncbi:NAD(P)H-dependent oxidoreductase [Sphingomonas piscis]|uniref:NAD(P)H-dependent oxidoreductase n=1 Tax=Sphingomonas piscis TaxID=2714943 RepID=A0A6G7YPK5_9SPHN|nr:NAD(P)H-dependent oxidoreductase [Sphingomonas piscis]QIK78678.1 NAD(P)H-dependent oxidoreductase [Sphingomonas piscis]